MTAPKETLRLCCYCCGDIIDGSFALVANAGRDANDRVFIAKLEHVERFDNAVSMRFVLPPQTKGEKL
jgi:hypothetical protein